MLAAVGVGLAQLTGSEMWDGLASIAIGLLLFLVATTLARSNISLLVGRAVPRRIHNQIADDLCRGVISQRIGRIKSMFKWAVQEEIISETVYRALKCVKGLPRGRGEARETDPIGPVPDPGKSHLALNRRRQLSFLPLIVHEAASPRWHSAAD